MLCKNLSKSDLKDASESTRPTYSLRILEGSKLNNEGARERRDVDFIVRTRLDSRGLEGALKTHIKPRQSLELTLNPIKKSIVFQ
jgi:hypothetical protein